MTKRSILVAAIFGTALSLSPAQSPLTPDQLICNKIFSSAFEQKLIDKPVGSVMTSVAKSFLGAPYVGGTLDSTIDEHLVINLRGFDCVTLIENTLALVRAVKSNTLTYDAFMRQLQLIRYRRGHIDGYASRLNYFSEWIYDNLKKGVLVDVTRELGGIPYKKEINFMSKHRNTYKKLAADSTYASIKAAEAELASTPWYYIRKSRIAGIESRIEEGDIIAITTSIEGLDISHTAIAVKGKDGRMHLLHAPDTNGTVRITDETISGHLAKHPSQTGIVVARIKGVISR